MNRNNNLYRHSGEGLEMQKVQVVDLRAVLEKACKDRGAVAFGIASVDEYDSLPPIKIEYTVNRWSKRLREDFPDARSAIVFGIPSIDDADELGVRRSNGEVVWPGYMPISIIAREIAKQLQRLGLKAQFASELSSHKRLAVLAGIGAYGKNSLIISPKHGPWLRLGIVVTNAPMKPDKPFTADLCGKCQRCVDACPTGALKPYVADPDKCLVGIRYLDRVPEKYKAPMKKYMPQLTSRTHIMCSQCQLSCRYTTAERKASVMACTHVPGKAKARKGR